MLHALHRLHLRHHEDSPRKVSFDESRGEVCTPSCRRDARLDAYHYSAHYHTLIDR